MSATVFNPCCRYQAEAGFWSTMLNHVYVAWYRAELPKPVTPRGVRRSPEASTEYRAASKMDFDLLHRHPSWVVGFASKSTFSRIE
jgi:hypothetical protein